MVYTTKKTDEEVIRRSQISYRNIATGLMLMAGILVVLGYYVFSSRASSPSASVEVGANAIAPATTVTDSSASSGSAVMFKAATANSCSTKPNKLTLSGDSAQFRTKTTNDTYIDATSASWNSGKAGSYPVYFDYYSNANQNLCFYGGKITGLWNESTEPWDTYHGAYAIQVHSPNMIFDSVRIHNYGDGIGFGDGNPADWTIRNVWISHSHDDCVENDYMKNGIIENSLLETCFSIVSARGHSGQSVKPDGRNSLWTIRNTMLGIYAIDQPYKPSSYESPGHGGLFKWSEPKGSEGYGTKIALENVIIHLDGRKPNHQDYNVPYYEQNGVQISYLTSCKNVTIVWGGELRNGVPYYTEGSAAGTSAASQFTRWPAGCMSMTTDQNIWNQAVTNWKAAHPGVK